MGHKFEIDEKGLLRVEIDGSDGYAFGISMVEKEGKQVPALFLTKPGMEAAESVEAGSVAAITFASMDDIGTLEATLSIMKSLMGGGVESLLEAVMGGRKELERSGKGPGWPVNEKEVRDGRGH